MSRFQRTVSIPLLALILAACGAEAPDDPGPAVRVVQTQTARPLAEVRARTFSGTFRAPLETKLSFRVPGQVTRIAVDVGTRVEAGQTIARLDPEDYRLEVEAARASYRQAVAAAENARAELQRIRALYAEDNVSVSAYDRARTALETSRSRAEAAERRLDLARKRLGYTRLTAPAPGSVGDKLVEEGENVGAGQPVVRLTSGRRLEVQVQVPEALIARVEVGQRAQVHTTVLGGARMPATVTEVASAPGGRRPTYPVVVTLDSPSDALRSGMTARVDLDLGSGAGLVVPPEAVSQDDRGRFVYVVDPPSTSDSSATGSGRTVDGHIVRRAVDTGALTADGLAVQRGLTAGDRVVTAGLSRIDEGDPVRRSTLLSQK